MNQNVVERETTSINAIGMNTTGAGSKIAPETLGDVVRFSEVMARGGIALPKHLRGEAGACMAVAMQALQWEMNPFAVASKSYSVSGVIAYEAQLIAAVVNTRSGIQGRLRYKFEGEGEALICKVSGILDGEECVYESPPVGNIKVKNSPLWASDTQQQLGYYSARAWARRFCPEVMLGVYDREEAENFRGPDHAKDVTPQTADMASRYSKPSQTIDQIDAVDDPGPSELDADDTDTSSTDLEDNALSETHVDAGDQGPDQMADPDYQDGEMSKLQELRDSLMTGELSASESQDKKDYIKTFLKSEKAKETATNIWKDFKDCSNNREPFEDALKRWKVALG